MAKAKTSAETKNVEVISDILRVSTGSFDCCVLGTSPIILNRLSEKAKHELLLPAGRKTATDKLLSLKHDPIAEFRSSPYTLKQDGEPTLLAVPTLAVKGALRTAALDMPGMKKAQIGRLTYIAGEWVHLYGLPQLLMRPVRSADMNRTPDIRTRAIVPQWACRITVTFVQPLIRAQAVANLLAAAGITVGIGDWRPEKGSANYGQFELVDADDERFQEIIARGGREAQVAAMASPVCYDDETTELLSWYGDERQRRNIKGVA